MSEKMARNGVEVSSFGHWPEQTTLLHTIIISYANTRLTGQNNNDCVPKTKKKL